MAVGNGNVLNAGQLFNAGNRSNAEMAAVDDRPQAQVWLNIGVLVDTVDAETGEPTKELLTLPVNLAIDTMKKREVPTSKPKTAAAKAYRDRIIASNALLDHIQKFSVNIAAGEHADLEGFTMQLQRVNEKLDENDVGDPADNVYLASIGKQFGVGS